MSDQRPILVIHGVANHDKNAFEQRVAEFNQKINQGSAASWVFTPVFWGDLGAEGEGIEDTIPVPPLLSVLPVREGEEVPDEELSPDALELLNALFAYRPGGAADAPAAAGGYQPVRSDETKRDTMAGAAKARAAERAAVRDDQTPDEVAKAIQASWADVVYLKAIDDPGLLRAIGRAVANAVTTDGALVPSEADGEAEEPGQFAVREDEPDDEQSEIELRRPHPIQTIEQVTSRVVYGVDRAVGAVLGEVLGSLQEFLRQRVSRGVAQFVGDVLVYQRNQAKIQDRLWSRMPVGWGADQDHAVDVIAHSLGGVIAFDAATTSARRLFVRHLVTFGSQASFFQVVDPRAGLTRYVPKHDGYPAQAIPLPPSIQSWESLWEPLDPLAFLAGIFRLASQETPTDAMVPHAPAQLWTHSAYWTSDYVRDAIRRVLSG